MQNGIWNQNIGGNGPDKCDPEKKERCGGIIENLFNTKIDGTGEQYREGSEEQYYLVSENVTPVMSIGVGLDKMQELLDRYAGDYKISLQKYNIGNPNYVNDIIERVNQKGTVQGD